MSMYEKGKARLGYVYASPLVTGGRKKESMELLDTAEELSMIRKKLRESQRQIYFRASVATVSNLRELLTAGCRMLHYTGHGSPQFLAFESDQDRSCGVMKELKVQPLQNLFRAGGITTQLVFISSCSSELTGNAFVEAGVPHVVAVKVQEKITDATAQQFCGVFYHSIISDKSVGDAFDIALHTVKASLKDSDGDSFLLLPIGGNHDVKIFETLPEGQFTDETPPPPPNEGCPNARRFYLGTVALQRVVEKLVDPQTMCFTVTGEHGAGKTEVALQACVYVQDRRRFDAIFFADCKNKAADAAPTLPDIYGGGRHYTEDFCRLIGVAIGMPKPGPISPEALRKFLFTHPTENRRSDLEKVLLVLDGVDALIEQGAGEARDNLVDLLSQLCRFGRGKLTLLLTSEETLLEGTNRRFQNGSEKVVKVMPLKDNDMAKLLINVQPRHFLFPELKLERGVSHEDILKAVAESPVVKALEGHPGALLRFAPFLNDRFIHDEGALDTAVRCRTEFKNESRVRRHSRTSSNTSNASSTGGGHDSGRANATNGVSPVLSSSAGPNQSLSSDFGSGSFSSSPVVTSIPNMIPAFSNDSHFNPPHNSTSPVPQRRVDRSGSEHPLLEGAGMGSASSKRSSSQHRHSHSESLYPHSSSPSQYQPHHGQQQHQHQKQYPRQKQPNHLRRVSDPHRHKAVQELEPEAPQMNPSERLAWDTARAAGIDDRGCRLVWVRATANAAAVAAATGWGAGGSGEIDGVSKPDRVTWESLSYALSQHVCGMLTIPSSNDTIVDDGPYAWVNRESRGRRASYGSMNAPPARTMNSDELGFVRGVLRSKEELVEIPVNAHNGGLRGAGSGLGTSIANDMAAFRPFWASDDRGAGNERGHDKGRDMISLRVFFYFAKWWAPLVATLAHLKKDWASNSPVRVHGFMGRLQAERELESRERGTFLLRFSESKPGKLVVSFADSAIEAPGMSSPSIFPHQRPSLFVQHVLVAVCAGGRCVMKLDGDMDKSYRSLHHLVRESDALQTLFPNVPKETAFDEVSPGGMPRDGSVISPPPNVSRYSGGADSSYFSDEVDISRGVDEMRRADGILGR